MPLHSSASEHRLHLGMPDCGFGEEAVILPGASPQAHKTGRRLSTHVLLFGVYTQRSSPTYGGVGATVPAKRLLRHLLVLWWWRPVGSQQAREFVSIVHRVAGNLNAEVSSGFP
jgi:hypothetical protein